MDDGFVWNYDFSPGSKAKVNLDVIDREDFAEEELAWIDKQGEEVFTIAYRWTVDGYQYYETEDGMAFLGSELIKED